MEFKINFKIDYISNEEIPIKNLTEEIKELKIIKRNLYFWESDILNKPEEIELCLKKLSL